MRKWGEKMKEQRYENGQRETNRKDKNRWRFANKFNNQLAEANQFSCFVHRALRPTEREMEGVKRTPDIYCIATGGKSHLFRPQLFGQWTQYQMYIEFEYRVKYYLLFWNTEQCIHEVSKWFQHVAVPFVGVTNGYIQVKTVHHRVSVIFSKVTVHISSTRHMIWGITAGWVMRFVQITKPQYEE